MLHAVYFTTFCIFFLDCFSGAIIRENQAGDEVGMHQYPSDINREEYEQIRENLEGARKKTRPREYDLYDVFCAVLYVVQGGIQW